MNQRKEKFYPKEYNIQKVKQCCDSGASYNYGVAERMNAVEEKIFQKQ
jgi:hypothetical protein